MGKKVFMDKLILSDRTMTMDIMTQTNRDRQAPASCHRMFPEQRYETEKLWTQNC